MISRNPTLDDGYWDPKQINPIRLIKEVKQHELLYNPNHEHHSNKAVRDEIWDAICTSMFPLYPHYKSAIKLQIGCQVRHRWKTLRSSAARITKLKAVNENYSISKSKVKEMAELQFVVPYIKVPNCDMLNENKGLTNSQSEETFANDLHENCITEEELQPVIKEEKFEYHNYDDELDDEEIMNIQLSPLSDDHYEEPASTTASHKLVHPVVLHYKEDQITKSIPLISKSSIPLTPTITTSTPSAKSLSRKLHESLTVKSDELLKKRPRMYNYSPSSCPAVDIHSRAEMQRKLMDLLISNEKRKLQRESQAEDDPTEDVDRMFLLSLVADFKHLPNNKKMSVKAKIATIIAEAIE